MSQNSLLTHKPAGFLRMLVRFPILLYRLKLGWLLGKRFVLLNHIGRKSGLKRQTVVEVIDFDKEAGTYYIASGWGYTSNWYQNLLAKPSITIQVGLKKLKVVARTLSAADSVKVLLKYQAMHPFAARELSRFLGFNIINASPGEIEKYVREALPVIELARQNG